MDPDPQGSVFIFPLGSGSRSHRKKITTEKCMEIVNNCNFKKKLRVLETQLPSDGGHLQQTLQKVFFYEV